MRSIILLALLSPLLSVSLGRTNDPTDGDAGMPSNFPSTTAHMDFSGRVCRHLSE